MSHYILIEKKYVIVSHECERFTIDGCSVIIGSNDFSCDDNYACQILRLCCSHSLFQLNAIYTDNK